MSDAERAAGAAYAQAADIADRAVKANDDQLDDTTGTEADFRAYYLQWADVERDFVTAVENIAMPDHLAADRTAVMDAYRQVETVLRRFETEPLAGWDRVKLELNAAITAAIRASNVLRPRLGLPTAEEAAPT